MSFTQFNIINHIIFKIDNLKLNTPINILYDDKYLSSAEIENMVDFYTMDDNSGRQKWIIEQENDNYYIRLYFERFDKKQYLGYDIINNMDYL